MRIHVVGINYWPDTTGIAPFSTGRAEALAARGHHVTMCAAPPYYPEWRIAAEYRGRLFARELRAGVDIRRCPLYVPSRVTPLRRVLHEASFAISALVRSLFCQRPDVLLVVSPPLGLGVAAWVLARLWRVPYVFHVEDLQPDTALDLGMMRPGYATRLLHALEAWTYRGAVVVSTLTDAMRDRIVAKGIDRGKVVLFSGWADPELFNLESRADDAVLRRELGLGEACVVLHAGNIGVKQGLDVVLDAAERTRSLPEIVYVLVGDGAARARLEARVAASRLVNVRLMPLLPLPRFQRLLATADIALVTQRLTVADVVFPSKVRTLFAAGKPVVASVSAGSEVARALLASHGGLMVPPEDPGALVEAIERLRTDPLLRKRMGVAGREFARRQWAREPTLDYLVRTIEAVAGARRVPQMLQSRENAADRARVDRSSPSTVATR